MKTINFAQRVKSVLRRSGVSIANFEKISCIVDFEEVNIQAGKAVRNSVLIFFHIVERIVYKA